MTETPKSLTGKWIVNWVTRGPQKTKWGEGPRFMWGGREVTLCCRYTLPQFFVPFFLDKIYILNSKSKHMSK